MLKAQETIIDVQPDALLVARRVAGWMLSITQQSEKKIAICLSGGSTPKLLYETLATKEFSEQFPWQRIHWFWGDERYVPQDSPLSNYSMVREALFAKVPIPSANIHPIETNKQNPDEAAADYEKQLKVFYGADYLDPQRCLFDITLLGLGPDGHTASLFPDTAVLNERNHWTEAVVGVKPEVRITLTYPVLESSSAVVFIVTGQEKRAVAQQVLSGKSDLPAARLKPSGTEFWFFDQAACSDNLKK